MWFGICARAITISYSAGKILDIYRNQMKPNKYVGMSYLLGILSLYCGM